MTVSFVGLRREGLMGHETLELAVCTVAANSFTGLPLLALDGPIRRNAKKLGLSLVEQDL